MTPWCSYGILGIQKPMLWWKSPGMEGKHLCWPKSQTSTQGRSQDFSKGGVTLCQSEATHQIVMSTSTQCFCFYVSDVVRCLVKKGLQKGGHGNPRTQPWLRPCNPIPRILLHCITLHKSKFTYLRRKQLLLLKIMWNRIDEATNDNFLSVDLFWAATEPLPNELRELLTLPTAQVGLGTVYVTWKLKPRSNMLPKSW